MGEIRILNQHGDEKLEWDPADAAQVKTARAKFNDLKKQGYKLYAVQEARGHEVTRFDKNLGRLLAAPGARSAEDKRAGSRPAAMAGGPTARSQVLR